ncbi:Acg family FMN-binding oxidoreductase [Paractinoplanes hotanensis]|uniref:Nitroreductase n=1 Tax=Paractinoplanes hotanensis TaxID=2906497 RepID=A0ABT0YEC0_9ACTN|nr:nitroreductase [Actinoplanes hotanensis]MCM4084399.1 nitroreductase [Actinoplanes hotanensis]
MTPLEQAVLAAGHAPSIFNTQPWSWRIEGATVQLFADPDRKVTSIDPDGRLLLLSCGAALHHARVWLRGSGWSVTVDRLPDSERPDLLARLVLGKQVPPDPEAVRMAAVIPRRHTDRRSFGARTVSDFELTKLRRFVETEGAYLHTVRREQVAALAFSMDAAEQAELYDPAYRSDLRAWTQRPGYRGDGVTPDTAVKPGPRRVPVRDFFPASRADLDPGIAHDEGAAYVVLFGLGERPIDLLRGGEALSALLLLATADGLATAPLSDAVEREWPRQLVRHLLTGLGEPFLIVRLGYRSGREPAPASARRDLRDFVTVTA